MASLMRRQTLRMLKKKTKGKAPKMNPTEYRKQKGQANEMMFRIFQERRKEKIPYRPKGKNDDRIKELWKQDGLEEAGRYVRKLKRKKPNRD